MRARRSITLGMLLLAPVASRPSWGAGHVDPAFGTGGAVVTPSGGQNAESGSRAVAVGSDGKIVALASGNAGATVVARFTATGALDPTFGTGGMTSLSLPNGFSPGAVAVRGGRIVVAGSSGLSPQVAALARLDGSGDLDPTFGTGGIVLTPMAGVSLGATRVAIAADGSVTAAGFSYDSALNWRAFVARYDASGVLDASYGAGGIAVVPLAENVNLGDLAVESDGRAVVVGGVGPPPPPQTSLLPYTNFYVARFDASGAPDAGFGTAGVVTGAVDGYFEGVALQPDGAIVAGGPAEPPGADLQTLIARFLPDGSPDATFGTGGFAHAVFPDGIGYAHRVLLQPDGRIVGVGSQIKYFWRPALLRVDANGVLDPGFGLAGLSFAPFFGGTDPTPGEHNFIYDAALAPDGDIVASSGMYLLDDAPPPAFRLHRFLGHGLPCVDEAAISDARLVMTGFGLPSTKTKIAFKGKVGSSAHISMGDAASTTIGVTITDATGAVVFEENVPALTEDGSWTYSGRRFTYDALDPAAALRRVRLLALAPTESRTGVQVKGKAARYGVAMPVPMPLTVTMLFNRSAGGCGRTTFAEGDCLATASRVRCR